MTRLQPPRPFGGAFLGVLLALSAAFAAIAFVATSARAEPSSSAGPGQYAVSLTSVTGQSVPLGAVSAQICVEGAAARYTDDGSTPSATIGIPVTAGQCFDFAGPLAAFKIIGSGATLDISYYSGIE